MKSFIYQINNSNPFKQIVYDLPINDIDKKAGTYIIDLQGQGISSRAVIYRGGIVCLSKTTLAGLQLKFYDESGKRIQQLDIWVKGKKQKVKKVYTIPFGSSQENIKIIAVKDSFAELIPLTIYSQNYILNVGYIYNPQSFIVGNKAKIIIHPRLYLHNSYINLKLLQNTKIQLQIINSQDIKSYLSYNNINLNNKQDYILQFPIQTFIKNIKIIFTTQIKLYNGQISKLRNQKDIKINLYQNTTNFINLYLKKQQNHYQILILGQNGQIIPHIDVLIAFKFIGINQIQQKQLRSNNKGIIKLGKLTLVMSITAKINSKYGNINRSWKLNNQNNQISYGQNLAYKKLQQIKIPLPKNYQIKQLIAIKLNQQSTTNIINKIKINNNILQLQSQQQGQYIIIILPLNKKIFINILSGKQWQQNNQIYNQKQKIIYQILRSSNQMITLGQSIIQQQQNDIIVNININTFQTQINQSVRIHAFVYNFIQPNYQGLFNKNYFCQNISTNTQIFSLKQCQYFNNKTLSDQQSYIYNRQQQKKFLGNNLQKPRILLKRLQLRQTTQKNQVLNLQGNYYPQQRDKQRSKKKKMRRDRKPQSNTTTSSIPIEQIDSHNNFLNLPCITIQNLKDTKISLKIPKGYNNMSVYLLSKDSAIQKQYILPNKQIKIKDLRHTGLLNQDSSKAWTMYRQSYPIRQGQQIKINRNCHWSAIGLSNIIEYASIKQGCLPDWIKNWKNYQYQKKLQIYSKQCCHQLNTFVKLHDKQFFKNIIKPFIKNKLIKTFVDYYLLDSKICKQYCQPQRLQKLNQFQKNLLIKYLIQQENYSQSNSIANSIILPQKSVKFSYDFYKKQFDTVINAKKSQQQIPDIKKSKQNKKQEINQYQKSTFNNLYGPPPPSRSVMKLCQGLPPPPPPPGNFACLSSPPPMQQKSISSIINLRRNEMSSSQQKDRNRCIRQQNQSEQEQLINQRKLYKPGFQPQQKTKQYIQTTYSNLKNPKQTQNLIKSSPFWASLAGHLISSQSQKQFITDKFIYLKNKLDFTLAACFLTNKQNPNYDITNQDQNLLIKAKSQFLIMIKQVRSQKYIKKFGILINQRFFDPQNEYIYQQDGNKIQYQVQQFIINKIYSLQTVITNTSGINVQLQILIDIPQGSIPLKTHQYTQIKGITISPYSTTSFNRLFYFPYEGSYALYPANACRGKQIIAKAQTSQKIQVKLFSTIKKMDSLNDVIRSGNQQNILQFLATKNIFDKNFFNPSLILWMLKDMNIYRKITNLLKQRKYYSRQIWQYSLYHKDPQTIKQYLQYIYGHQLKSQILPIYQYFPYYSSRTHKFLNQSKSTIRNIQFKQTYYKFLLISILHNHTDTSYKLTFIYYLLLQDRIDQASKYFSHLNEQQKLNHQLQIDYIICFLDMYQGYPNFIQARKLSLKYINYPIQIWKNLFKQVNDILNQYDSTTYIQQYSQIKQQSKIINQGHTIRILIPDDIKIQVYLFPINLQLYYSQFKFGQFRQFSAIKPLKCIIFQAGKSRQQIMKRPENMNDIFVEFYQSKASLPAKKIDKFHWTNPDLKIKFSQDKGSAQIFFKGQQLTGCYCKVYSTNQEGVKFYRDGYTDITGTFKYVLADFQGIKTFNVLFITQFGGIMKTVRPPSKAAYLG